MSNIRQEDGNTPLNVVAAISRMFGYYNGFLAFTTQTFDK